MATGGGARETHRQVSRPFAACGTTNWQETEGVRQGLRRAGLLTSLFARPDPDADLVAAARRGDARAFDALVARHQGPLQRFLRARLDAGADADDVAQEAFVAAWRELDRFSGRCQFKTWLFGIALNQCANTARRERRFRQQQARLEAAETRAAGLPAAPGSDWGAVVERVALRQRLAELPEPGRRVLELYYYGELNLREIAELLDVKVSTLKYWFYQAHERLRASLAARSEPEMQEEHAEVPR
jgi:RNA polymerase sigma-70 factor (ECF subfamily)